MMRPEGIDEHTTDTVLIRPCITPKNIDNFDASIL